MADSRGPLVLAGDVGGTKTYIGLFRASDEGIETVREERLINADFPSLEEAVRSFLGDTSGIRAATFGVACPVVENRCTLTNLSWTIDGPELSERLGIPGVVFINDLVATGWGIKVLTREDFHVLQEGAVRPGNAALIAAGTGLGEALLFGDGESYYPSASEGGHADFAPRNALEVDLLNQLIDVYGHVSYERVVSGMGLKNIYAFLRKRSGVPEPKEISDSFEIEDPAAVITSVALGGGDAVCEEAVSVMVSIFGAEAGNLALKCMAVGGVYVGGGIAPKILPMMEEGGAFIRAFRDKGRFSQLLSSVPVLVIRNDRAALMGAALHASLLSGERGVQG